ncbi:alpha/beta hydrolase [Gordonia sp. (in: high G+C Gram-positive bacteria)]|uniref:alpha/beta hydrolase n=1 Tax=Gordonia sp. (in: high G+C Gram-positive bacteria) TaxID=84139 RepID=UPI003C769219
MTTLIVMPGTGSDADFVTRAFSRAAESIDARVCALEPAADLVENYRARLDQLADHFASTGEPFLVGGVSIGASIAANWILQAPGARHCIGVLAALPPWSGPAGDSVAAASAQITADAIERDGLEPTIAQMVLTSPEWLAAELSRSWRSLADHGLVEQLRVASTYVGPTLTQLAALPVPVGIAAAPDDPLHPIAVGRSWAQSIPHSVLREVHLTEFGRDERLLGDACLQAWQAASEKVPR